MSITPLIITFNEAPNIGRALDRLAWASRIVVVDSGSTDETLEIIASHPNVDVFHRPFDTFACQCNFGIAQVDSEWVLSLDADYILSSELVQELSHLCPEPTVSAMRARFQYCIGGRPLRSTLYPPRAVLYRRDRARYVDDGHGHRVEIDGRIEDLRHVILHDDRKPLDRWLNNQRSYARLEAEKLVAADPGALDWADRLRRRRLAPIVVPFYCLIAKGLIRDGAAGWRYTLERTYAEVLLALELSERRSRPPS